MVPLGPRQGPGHTSDRPPTPGAPRGVEPQCFWEPAAARVPAPGPSIAQPRGQPLRWRLARPLAHGASRCTGNRLWVEMTWPSTNATLANTSLGLLASVKGTLHGGQGRQQPVG